MNFEAHVPLDLEESDSYGTHVTIDQDGVDIQFWGETVSASFQGQDPIDLALAVMGEDFNFLEQNASNVLKLGAFTTESLENLAWTYLKAAQMRRNYVAERELAVAI